jgi:hypothetical protein
VILQKKLSQRQARFSQCKGIVDLAIKTDSSMYIDLERKFPNQSYVPIHRFRSNQPYGEHQFQYQEDLAGTDYPYINYRFKVTIGSDTSYYLDSIQIMYANPCTNIIPSADQVTIAPNPFHDRLEMKISTTSDADIRVFVFNEKGQKMLSSAFRLVAGTKNLVFNTAQLSNGIYFIQVMKGATQMSSLKAIRH